MCSVKLSQKIWSHELPGQEIGPALSTQHLCSRFEYSFVSKCN